MIHVERKLNGKRHIGVLVFAIAFWASLFSSVYSADPDVVINLISPTVSPIAGTASEAVFAPFRDIKVVGTLTGVDATDVQNMSFSVYKMNVNGEKEGNAIRTITTDLFTSGTGDGYWSRQNDTYANLTMFDNKIDFNTTAIPELVYKYDDADTSLSFNDPDNKAVLYTKKDGTIVFSAVILGGVTKGLDGGAGYDYTEDLIQGKYVLEVSATGVQAGGQTVTASLSETLNFTDEGRNIVFGRYTNSAHMVNMQSVARQTDISGNKYKIMIDPFAGYYTDPDTNEFGEIQARWKPNDYVEYEQAPKVLGFIYDISDTCATHHEIGAVMYQDHWNKTNDHQVYLYHYDIGDSIVQYRREDGSLATLSGALKLFDGSVDPNSLEAGTVLNNKYKQLDLTRVELYDAADTNVGTQRNIDDLTFYNKQVQRVSNYSHMVDGASRAFVFARPEQKIGLYGVVAPIESTVDKVDTTGIVPTQEAKGNLLYNIKKGITTVTVSLQKETDEMETKTTPVSLLRKHVEGAGVWDRTSIYEFKEVFDAGLEEGTYTLSTQGYSGPESPSAVERTNQMLDVVVTRTGMINGAGLALTDNQAAFGDSFLDALIEGNAPGSDAALPGLYINTDRNNAADTLTALSGSPTAAAVTELAFNPFTTLFNRLDDFNYRWLCSTNQRPDLSRNLWANYIHHWRNVDATDEIRDFDISGSGVVVGYDRWFDYGCLGVAYSYEKSEANGWLNTSELDDHVVMVYGKANLVNQLWLTGMYGYSFRDYKTERFVGVGTFTNSFDSSFGGNGQWANVRLERPFCLAKGMLTPFVGYEWNNEEFDGYQESGGTMALSMEERKEDYGWIQAGARLNLEQDRLTLGFRGMYVARVNGPDRAEYTAGFAGQDGYRYQYRGLAAEKSDRFFDANLETRYQLGEHSSALLGYNGLFGDRSTGHMLSAGMTTSW